MNSESYKIISRRKLKENAKEKINGNLWNVWAGVLVVYLITSAITYLTSFIDCGKVMIYEDVYFNGISSLVSLFFIPLNVGLTYYVLNITRDKEYNINDLFRFYKDRMWTILLVSILTSIFVGLWSLLLIIPGVIAGLSYSMCNFIYIDGEDTNAMDIIKKSKDMMYGYKWDFFVFNLSFIGWFVLCIFIIPVIFVLPYYMVSQCMYYDELKKIKENK